MSLLFANIVDAFFKHIGLYLLVSAAVIVWMIFEGVSKRGRENDGEVKDDERETTKPVKAVQPLKNKVNGAPSADALVCRAFKRVHWAWLAVAIAIVVVGVVGYLARYEFRVEKGVAYRMNRWTGKIERLPRSEVVGCQNRFQPTPKEKRVLDRLFKDYGGDLDRLEEAEARTVARCFSRKLYVENGMVHNVELPDRKTRGKSTDEMSDAELKAEITALEAEPDWWRMQAYLIWSTEFKDENGLRVKKPRALNSQARIKTE